MMRGREMKFSNSEKSLMILILAILSLVSGAWSACKLIRGSMFNYSCHYYERSSCKNSIAFNKCSNCNAGMAGDPSNPYYCTLVSVSVGTCDYWGTGSQGRFSPTFIECTTQTEADSVACVNKGDQWIDGSCCNEQCICEKEGGHWIDNQCITCSENDSTWVAKTCTYADSLNLYLNTKTDYKRVSCDTTHNATIAYYSATCDTANFDTNKVCLLNQDSCSSGIFTSASLPKDTTIESGDSTIMYECYFNCATKPNSDSTVFMVKGNIEIPGPEDSVSTGIKYNSISHQIRSTYGSIYVYDALGDPSYRYLDSAANATCVHHMYRGTKNGKYVYWYDNKEIPSGVTNVVRIK